MGLVGLASPREAPDDRFVGHIGARVLRSGVGGLISLWPPSFQN